MKALKESRIAVNTVSAFKELTWEEKLRSYPASNACSYDYAYVQTTLKYVISVKEQGEIHLQGLEPYKRTGDEISPKDLVDELGNIETITLICDWLYDGEYFDEDRTIVSCSAPA